MPLPMTDVILSQPMTRTRVDGVQNEVEIRFGTPTLMAPEPGDSPDPVYYCPIQLAGFQDDGIYVVYGGSTVEAVINAFTLAPVLLRTSLIAKDLDWAELPNYGFPILPPMPVEPEDPHAKEINPTEG